MPYAKTIARQYKTFVTIKIILPTKIKSITSFKRQPPEALLKKPYDISSILTEEEEKILTIKL